MTANTSQFMDPTWNFSGWVELYNGGEDEVNIHDWFVSDEATHPEKFKIEADQGVLIPPKGFHILWFDRNELNAQQVNFKLECEGGKLFLTSPTGEVLSLSYPALIQGTSYARTDDGKESWDICISPTPGASNQLAPFGNSRCSKPIVDGLGGLFTGSKQVSIKIPEGMSLRYTTDGTEPTEASQESISGEFIFTETTLLRLRHFAQGKIPSSIATHTYILQERAYELPIISIVTDPAFLFDDSIGIYVEGVNGEVGNGSEGEPKNWHRDWERPASIEFIDPITNEPYHTQDCDISIGGGYSRKLPQKSLVLNADKKFNRQNRFEYRFFSSKPNISLKHLLLRNSGTEGTKMRDATLQSLLMDEIDIECQAYQPAVQYINGEYYGIINIRERNNKQYVYSNYGYDEEEIDLFEMDPLEGYVQLCGDKEAFNQLKSLSQDAKEIATYRKIMELLDIDHFINYMAAELYVNNEDWAHNNLKGFRHKEKGRFRFILYDLDSGFENPTTNSLTLLKSRQYFLYVIGEEYKEVEITTIFFNLLNNEYFKRQFIDRYMLLTGSIFAPERVEYVVDSIAAKLQHEMIYHSAHWNNNSFHAGLEKMKAFPALRNVEVVNHLKDFFALEEPQQINLSSNHIKARLLVNDQPVPLGRFSGQLFPPLTITAEAPSGYRFERWEITSEEGKEYPNYVEEIDLPTRGGFTLQAHFVPLEVEGDSLSTHAVCINEVSAANSIYVNEYFKQNDWIELYNISSTPVDLAGYYLSDNQNNPLKYQIPIDQPQLTTIPAYSHKVIWCDGLATQTSLHATFKLSAESGVVMLTTPDEEFTETFTYTRHGGDESMGRFPDGGSEIFTFNRPTFNKPNSYTPDDNRQNIPPTGNEDLEDEGLHNRNIPAIYYKASSQAILLNPEATPNRLITNWPAKLTLFNAHGKKIEHTTLYSVLQESSVAELPRGLYIAIINYPDGNRGKCKFVK